MKFVLAAIIGVSLAALCHAGSQPTVGLITHTPGSLDSGYVLFAPQNDTTYLIDKCGKLVHVWPSTQAGGGPVYLLPNGNILRAGQFPPFNNPAAGGTTQIQDWDGNVLWSYVIDDSTHKQHHDVCMLPNGNILCLVMEEHSVKEAASIGKDTLLFRSPGGIGVITEEIVELSPVGADSAVVVWTWRSWDHIVQDYDPAKSNYGQISSHPELININYPASPNNVDWLHINSVSYNADLNCILVSVHNFDEVWIIDHGTTTQQAASHAGGYFHHGGDLIYRWGNPSAYNRALPSFQKFFGQHSAEWIPQGYPFAGKIMVFNNGVNRPDSSYTSVDIFSPAIDSPGVNPIDTDPLLPVSIDWRYNDPWPTRFICSSLGGAQMLSNGNVLICDAMNGTIFEIDSVKNMVWNYVQPVTDSGPMQQGALPQANTIFRATYYPYSYPAFVGRILGAGAPIEYNPSNYECKLNMTLISGVAENNFSPKENSLFGYPNPATDHVVVSDREQFEKLTLYNLLGEKILEARNTGALNTAAVPTGLYSLVISNNGIFSTKLISIVK